MSNRVPGVTLAKEALKKAQEPGIGRTLRSSRLERAIRHFNQSLYAARAPAVRAELLQGLLEAQCEIVKVSCDEKWTPQVTASIKHGTLEMLSTADLVLADPLSSGGQEEITSALNSFLSGLHNLSIASERLDLLSWLNARLRSLSQRAKLLPTVLIVFGHVAQETHHQALRDFEAGRWTRALNALRAIDAELRAYVELESGLTGGDAEAENAGVLSDMQGDIAVLVLSCEGSQLLHNGDLHFEKAMNCEPEDFLGWAQLAQDDYREALIHVTEHDIELEGMTLFRLARYHSKVTKMPSQAHTIYLRAVQLAAALSPALPRGTWYASCVSAVQEYRDALEAAEASKWHNRRMPFLAQLEPELERIAAQKDLSHLEFAKWVWAAWPPKTEGNAEFPPVSTEGEEGSGWKKAYLKVIQRYHPDRNSKFGDKWQVLAEEICKALNQRYGNMKGM